MEIMIDTKEYRALMNKFPHTPWTDNAITELLDEIDRLNGIINERLISVEKRLDDYEKQIPEMNIELDRLLEKLKVALEESKRLQGLIDDYIPDQCKGLPKG